MAFSSALFLFGFLPVFLLGAIFSDRLGPVARNVNIVVFSIAFYAFGSGLYTLLLIGSILFNWSFGRFVLARWRSPLLLAFGLLVNVLPLLAFKYLGFFLAVTNEYFFQPFMAFNMPSLKLFLPAGISFYTFQAISYLVDVYRRETLPEKSLLAFAAYKLFFPQLVAGPIVRYVEVRENMHNARMAIDGFNAGIFFFAIGLAKKMLIADPIGRQVDMIYGLPPESVTNFMAWFANVGYYLQIFFDFSGYSEMATGLGLMVGISFPENFRQPYRAHSITDFWRRWHMTLSRWFRDYLYIPLGGNKQGLTRTLTNLAIVFLLCGLWHGAAITFLAWGLYHGFLLMLERLAKKTFNIEPTGMVGFVTTTLLVLIGWVVFRSGDLGQAKYMLAKMAFVDRSGNSIFGWQYFLTPYIGTVAAIGLWFAWLPSDAWGVRARLRGTWAAAAAALGLILIASSIAELSANGFNPFIYFQF